jgi:hypothetical protein
MFVVSVVCCQVEVSATSCSLVQRGPTECAVSECDRESSIMSRPSPTGGCCTTVLKKPAVIVQCILLCMFHRKKLIEITF